MNTAAWKNRVISAILTVIMVFSMIPMSVFAAGSVVAEVTIDGTTTGYTDIDAAFAAAQEADSATVKLLADVTISHTNTYGIELKKGDITLELNGKTISQSANGGRWALSAVFYLSVSDVTPENFATVTTRLTVQDSVGGGKIKQPNGVPAVIANLNTTLTVNSGTIENTSSVDHDDNQFHMAPNCAVLLSGGGEAVINGGTLSGMRGVAVAGYISKADEEDFKNYLGIEGYNNDTYGNELTVAGGEISGTSGNALIVYDKAKKIELSGGTFTTQSNEHSIWVADSTPDGAALKGDAASLLKDGYRYENNGAECAYSENGNGVVGNATVAKRPANEYTYIDWAGKLTARANCTEITADTSSLTDGWYVVTTNVELNGTLSVTGKVSLILCDGATLSVNGSVQLSGEASKMNIFGQTAGTGTLKVTSSDGSAIRSANETVGIELVSGTVVVQAAWGYEPITGAFGVPSSFKIVRTDDLYQKSTMSSNGSSTTITKCVDHVWKYDRDDEDDSIHWKGCKLCSMDYIEESHKYDSWTSTDADTHTGLCACGATSTENHTLTLAPNDDGLTHSTKCSVCGYATAAEDHDFSSTDEFGNKKCACGVHLAAEYDGKNYATLESAIKAAKDGGKVTLQAVAVAENITVEDGTVTIDLNGKEWYNDNMNGAVPTLTVKGGSVTVQNGALIAGSSSKAATAVVVEGGKLTVGDGMTIQGGSMDKDKQFPAIEVAKSGELSLCVGAELGFGMKVSTEGKQLKDYLPEGTAFTVNGTAINGYVTEYSRRETLVVAAHTSHSFDADGKCDCGFECTHSGGTASYFKKAVCTVCGAEYGQLLTDTTPPTGRITVTERNWFETFINTITFNLFFKEELTGKITATDDSYAQAGYDENKHAVKIEYIVSDKALTSAELTDWVAYDADKGIDLTGERKYVVYACLTDHAGNETLLSTDGFEIDKTAPSIGDFTDGQEVHICSGQYTVSVEDENLKEVTVDGKKQTGNSITFKMAEFNNTHTVVAEDKAGNISTVKFTLHGGHSYNIDTGVCENGCGAAAEVRLTDGTGTRVWGKYADALIEIMRSNTPVTLTLLKDCGDNGGHPTQYSKDGLDLTIDLNGHNFGNALDQLCVLSQTADGSAKLNLIGEGSFKTVLWLGRGATLTVGEDVTYVGGIKIWYDTSFGDRVTGLSVSLKGGKYGEIDMRYTDRDGIPMIAAACGELVAPGYVFDRDDEVFSEPYATDVTVILCTNHNWIDGVCDNCNLICTHNWVDSKCTVCGYECLHSTVEERGGDTYCTEMCGEQMAVKVAYKDVNGTDQTKYYAQSFEIFRGEVTDTDSTLKDLFNNNTVTPDGSTVTLLVDRLQAFAHVQNGRTITLNLNDKTLIETGNGICAYNDNPNNKLIVTGIGHSVETVNRAFAVYGGTLEFDSGFGGEFHEVYASGGTLTFAEGQSAEIDVLTIGRGVTVTPLKSGKFGEIKISEAAADVSVKAGDLLEMRHAFRKGDGSYVPYDTVITATGALANVTVVWCDHGMTEMPTGNQYNKLKCPDCGEPLNAVLKTADGKINGYEELTSAYGKTTALSVAGNTPGCTVTMYYEADGLGIWSTAEGFTLDANDCTIGQLTLHSGTLTVKNATITGRKLNGGYSVKTYYNSTVATLTLEDCLVEKQDEGFEATLTTNGPVTLKNTTVEGTTKVYSDKEQGLTVEGSSVLVGDARVDGNLTFKSGNASTSKITVYGAAEISGGLIYELDASDAGSLTVSGGKFGKITAPNDGRLLIDCLKDGYAFYVNGGDNSVVDGRTGTLEGVKVMEHTHGDYKWDPATHEKVCACGHVTETDTTAPTISDIADGETYYQNTLTFTATDIGSGLASVKDGGKALTADARGEYTITADNKPHTITATDNAGNTAVVTVTAYKVYRVTLVSGTGYTVEGNPTVGHGQDYTFTVKITKGYSATRDFTVYLNGSIPLVTPDPDSAGVYTFTFPNAPQDLSFTVEGIADITAPDAKITIGTNSFNSFLNRITFGLFFKKTQTVTVSATDAGSGVKTVEYLLSDTAFKKPEDITGSWTEIRFSDGKAAFDIDPNAKAFIYVRVTDKAGNVTVINSDGVVIYTDSTADTERISFTRLSDKDVSFKVNFNGNWFDQMFISNGKTTESIPGIVSSDGTVTLKNAELRKLAVGEYIVTVTYNPMGEKYVEAEGNEAPATTTVKLTVARATRTSLVFDVPNAVYDGKAYDDLTITDKPDGTVIQYKTQGADDSNYTTDAPKNAGSYTVRITTPQDENYNAAVFTTAFTISPKKVSITGVTSDSKTYNGNTEAAIIADDAALSVNYDGENLTIDASKAKAVFDSKNVGTYKTVTFSGFALGGAAAGNYELAAQPEPVTANIVSKNLTVENLKVKDKVYDGTNKAELDGTPTLKGVEDGDEVQLDCGSPTFATTDVGENIAINFTLFFLSGTDSGNYTLTQPTGITGNIAVWIADGSEYGVNSNDWINTDFIVTAKTGYQLSLDDTANGTWTDTLSASNETADGKLTFYVKNTATGAISAAVTEHYKIDKTAPTGTVKLDERTPFEEFLHKITFGLFFKDDVTVKLTASDEASGVKSREYYKSDKALTLEEVKALTDSDWTAADSFGITAEDMAQFVIYARITDNAGNITYLSSDGAEFDTTVPEIIGVENGETYYVTRRVAVDDANLKSVTVNGEPVDMDAPFDLVGDKNAVYTVVATDKAGNVTEYAVTMKPISDIADAIKDITEENVKSSDADAIDAVTQQILDIAAESDEEIIGEGQWNKLTKAAASCKKLQTRIAKVAAESERLTDEVTSCDIDKVTSADIADIEPLITDIDTLLVGGNLTDTERAELEALKHTAQALLDRIADAKSATEDEEVNAVKDIAKDNVTADDKDALEKAEKVLEKALDDFDGNYTEDERKSLNDRLDAVKAALDAIDSAEKAAEEIKKLPSADDVKLTDKDEIERISKILDDLTDNEKALIGEDALGKLKALNEKLTELADNAKKPTSPSTGDTSNLALWIALLFISGSAVTATTVISRKKKHSKE